MRRLVAPARVIVYRIDPNVVTRRHVLTVLTLSTLPVGCIRQVVYRARLDRGAIEVPWDEIAQLTTSADSVRVEIEDRREVIVLRRHDGEISAVIAGCTHSRCDLLVAPDGYDCPCHGSRFDVAGAVLRGPASEPLAKLQTERRGDVLVIRLEGAG